MKRKSILLLLGLTLFCAGLFAPHAAGAVGLGDLLNLNPDLQAGNMYNAVNAGGVSGVEIDVASQSAAVTFATADPAELVLEIYEDYNDGKDEDPLKTLISSKTAAVPASSETVSISVEQLDFQGNSYFIVKAYLRNPSTRDPIGDPFVDFRYTQDIQRVMNTTYEKLSEEADTKDRVIGLFTNEGRTSYALLNSSVTIVYAQSNQVMNVENEGGNILKLSNAPQSILGLKKGDKLCVIENADQPLFDLSAYNDPAFRFENATGYREFHFIQLEETPSQENGIWTLKHDGSEIGLNGFIDFLNIRETFNLGTYRWNNVPIPNGYTSGKVKLTGIVEIYVGLTKVSCAVKVGYEMDDASVDISLLLTDTIPLEVIPVGIPGVLSFDITFGLLISCQGAITLNFDLKGEIGAKFNCRTIFPYPYYTNASTLPKYTSNSITATGDFFAGPAISASVNVISVLEIGVEVAAGPGFNGSMDDREYLDKDQTQWHACGPWECLKGEIYLKTFADMYVKIPVLITESITLATLSARLTDYYSSSTFDTSGFQKCPHIGYLTNVEVCDYSDPPQHIYPIEVSYNKPAKHYESKASTRISSGFAKLYLPYAPDEVHTATACWTDPASGEKVYATASLSKNHKQTDSLTIKLDTVKHKITFQDVGSDPVPVPAPITGWRGDAVKIPDDVLAKPGREFLGWSLKSSSEPNEIYCHPGDELTMEGDMVLYAVYINLNPDVFYVLYEAPGASAVPAPEMFTQTQTAKITDQIPVRPGFDFQGWSKDRIASEVHYTSGADIPFGEQSRPPYLRLYAVWRINPVIVYQILYDAGPGTGAPQPQTAALNTRVQLSFRRPVYQAHLFRGWSRVNPPYFPSFHPGEWFPGSNTDVTLYAVWETDYMVLFGLEQPWITDYPTDLNITANGIPMDFRSLWINGKKVPNNAYTLDQANMLQTVLTISKDYLLRLGDGKHTVVVKYADGESPPAILRIYTLPPLAGDPVQPALYVVLMAASFVIVLTALKRRRTIDQ